MAWQAGNWRWSKSLEAYVQFLSEQGLWQRPYCRVMASDGQTLLCLPKSDLLSNGPDWHQGPFGLGYIASAARIANAQAEGELLSPLEANVIPLPHQLKALRKAFSQPQLRYLFADEVGLGKTIEAGLVIRELKLRGMAKRILVCAPKGLVSQWLSEMQQHFNETFHLLQPGDYKTLDANDNLWCRYDQVVCSLDSIKPIEYRKGWTAKQLHAYNKTRFDDVLAAGWDLIVIDEAHRLGGSTDQVARFKLGQGLADAAPYLLLLSATPHQGKTDAFHRLLSLLDAKAFPDLASVTKERVQPFVVRTEKGKAIDAEGKRLFNKRYTELVPVAWGSQHSLQKQLYEAVTDYIRDGYNQAKAKRQNAIGFLMILMQRLVSSSSRAIAKTLSKRLEALEAASWQTDIDFSDDWQELDSQSQLDDVVQIGKRSADERAEVAFLLELAERCVATETDAKAEALLDWIYKLQQQEQDPKLKLLVFTEFVPTQQMLAQYLAQHGISVVCLNGSMDLHERKQVQLDFANETRVLISTDAGGEGLNLQFCHIIVNYDMPWNPMRVEQRIGRVDRIGQPFVVRALNFVLENTAEHRVREVLEEKLQVILDEFGVDKTSDVLDSSASNHLFDELFMTNVVEPEQLDHELAKALEILRDNAQEKRQQDALFGGDIPLALDEYQKTLNHPMPYWIEQMVAYYLKWQQSIGKPAKFALSASLGFEITWPDGEKMLGITFNGKFAQQHQLTLLTLEDTQVAKLYLQLPLWVPSMPIPIINFTHLPSGAAGVWALWRVELQTLDGTTQRYLPIFINSQGRYFAAASARIWEAICQTEFEVMGSAANLEQRAEVCAQLSEVAEREGEAIFDSLHQAYLRQLERDIEKTEFSFIARRRAIDRIGLPEVRQYRTRQLDLEQQEWERRSALKQQVFPQLSLMLVVEIQG
ncbi:DEAD/DEAH box helicase [Shewanella xiamenensis]|uniref:DEAD/DEAH box helicase n=1 Tax=Shewanella xiamenensis TaxID=332186 RepID=UPI000849C828|nr:helicase-related protein [Shewanella xiamenensis]ODR87379.1 helicase [Shewanella xiamenensis]